MEFEIVGKFLEEIKKEFTIKNKKSNKITELNKVEQE